MGVCQIETFLFFYFFQMKMNIYYCYKCNGTLNTAKYVKEDVELKCLKCSQCGEEYFTSSELVRFDILSGKQKAIRHFNSVDDSTIFTSTIKSRAALNRLFGAWKDVSEKELKEIKRAWAGWNDKNP